jgi:transposase-like protein
VQPIASPALSNNSSGTGQLKNGYNEEVEQVTGNECPKCESEQIVKNGKVTLKDNSRIQKYSCRACTQRFNERTGAPTARLEHQQ